MVLFGGGKCCYIKPQSQDLPGFTEVCSHGQWVGAEHISVMLATPPGSGLFNCNTADRDLYISFQQDNG